MDAKQKGRISNVMILIIILVGIICSALLITGKNWTGLAWFIVISNLIAGPACLIAYIGEVRKGIFKDQDNEG